MSQLVDTSTRALQQTGAQIQKLLVALPSTIEAQLADIQHNANKIADQENLIAANNASIELQVREAAAEITLRVKENSSAVLTELLADRQLVALPHAEVVALENRATQAEAEAEAKVNAAVKAAVNSANTRHEQDMLAVSSKHKVEIAQLTANAKSDASTIEMLRAQVASLQETIAANRDAETKRMEALSRPAVNVTTSGK